MAVGPVPVALSWWADDLLTSAWLAGEAPVAGGAAPAVTASVLSDVVCDSASASMGHACAALASRWGVGGGGGGEGGAGRGWALRAGAGALVGEDGVGLSADVFVGGRRWALTASVPLEGLVDEAASGDPAVLASFRAADRLLLFGGLGGLRFSPGGAGLVRTAADSVPYAGLELGDVALPGWLGSAKLRITTTLARLSADRPLNPRAWWWTTRATARAGELELGLNRSIVFGGDGPQVFDASLQRVLYMLIGKHNTEVVDSVHMDFDDQIVSLDARWRPGGTPLALYGEWGSEDSAGGFVEAPALRAGAQWGWAGGHAGHVGVEAALVRAHRDPPWFRHLVLGPYLDDAPLGHPLMGDGRELRAYAAEYAPALGVRLRADAWARWRDEPLTGAAWGDPGAPVPGEARYALSATRAAGGALRLEWEPRPGLVLGAGLAGWRGGGRDRLAGDVGVRWVWRVF